MAESEQKHRHNHVDNVLKEQVDLANKDIIVIRRGQALGMLSVILMVGFCSYLAYIGNSGAAATVACTVIVGLAGIFIWNKKKPDKA